MELGEIKMRSDYALYTVAIILFILTLVAAFALAESQKPLWVVTTAILGFLFIGLGYSQRPKPTATTIEASTVPIATTTVTEEKTEAMTETAPTVVALTDVKGIGEKRTEQLKALGINNADNLAKASAKDLASKLKISPKFTRRWIENAKKLTEKS